MLVGFPCSRVCPTSMGMQAALTDLDKLLKEAGIERRDMKVGRETGWERSEGRGEGNKGHHQDALYTCIKSSESKIF